MDNVIDIATRRPLALVRLIHTGEPDAVADLVPGPLKRSHAFVCGLPTNIRADEVLRRLNRAFFKALHDSDPGVRAASIHEITIIARFAAFRQLRERAERCLETCRKNGGPEDAA